MSSGSQGPPDDLDDGDDAAAEPERKRLFERALPEALKRLLERAVETGVEKLVEGPESLRQMVSDLKLPKEVAHYIYTQIDDTKKGLYRVVAKEIRDVLEHTNLSDEIAKVLTKLSFEISTQVRFVPNPVTQHAPGEGEDAQAGGVQPASDKPGESPDGNAKGASSAPRQRLPRPEIVSKVVMRARDRRRD